MASGPNHNPLCMCDSCLDEAARQAEGAFTEVDFSYWGIVEEGWNEEEKWMLRNLEITLDPVAYRQAFDF